MYKRILALCAMALISTGALFGCGTAKTQNETAENKTIEVTTEATTKAAETETVTKETMETTVETTTSHSHTYTEKIEAEATCEVDGVKVYVCECGDSYKESIVAIGHNYGNYVYNNDATYLADGTETATCVCGLTDTRRAEGSKLEYTYTDLDQTMWTSSIVNVRDLPSESGGKLGALEKAQETHVTGQCLQTEWYRIEYEGASAYVSNSYLQDSKPVIEPPIPMPEENSQPVVVTDNAQSEACPYELYVIYYDNQGYPYYYGKWGGSANMDAENMEKTEACDKLVRTYMSDNYTVWNEDHTSGTSSQVIGWQFIGTYQGMPVVVRYVAGCNGIPLASAEERGIPTAGNGIWID